MPDSELRLAIMASVAQDEVRKLSERVKFGFSWQVIYAFSTTYFFSHII